MWRLVADLTPEEFVRLIDFRYITDALTPDEALAILRANPATKDMRIAEMEKNGYPAYTTSAGWLGYSDDKVRSLTREAMRQGLDYIKIKVGRDLADDKKRCKAVREEIGPNRNLMIDANQIWDVGAGDRVGDASWRPTSRCGSRSRPRPTTCWATPRSARR